MKQAFTLILLLFLATACKKKDVAPIDQLPPATQEGKGTLGFLVNGQAWTPKGNNGTPNLGFYYDPGYKAGEFNLSAYRIPAKGQREHFVISTDSLNFKRTFSLNDPSVGSARFTNDVCSYNRDEEVFREGRLTVTKLDLQKHIVSGTFEFTLFRPSCDTVKVTDGRFDLKF
jgi:hypothetical protein